MSKAARVINRAAFMVAIYLAGLIFWLVLSAVIFKIVGYSLMQTAAMWGGIWVAWTGCWIYGIRR